MNLSKLVTLLTGVSLFAGGAVAQQKFENNAQYVSPKAQNPIYGSSTAPDSYQDMKREFSEKYGIDYMLQLAPIMQVDSEGNTYLDNETDFNIYKRFWENDEGYGKIVFSGVMVNMLNDSYTRQFANGGGLGVSQPNGGMTGAGKNVTAINALWWEESMWDRQFTYRVGQLYTIYLFAQNKYLRNDRETFLASPFSLQGLSWAGANRAIGATFSLQNDWAYVLTGFHNAKPTGLDIDVASLKDGKFVKHLEFGLTPSFDFGEGSYKVSMAHIDDTGSAANSNDPVAYEANKEGTTLSVSMSQDFGSVGLFARFNRSYDRYAADAGDSNYKGGCTNACSTGFATKASAVGGVVFNAPFGRADDTIGIGYAEVEPTATSIQRAKDAGLVDDWGIEKSMEVYYEFALTPRLSVAPDLQYYFTPSISKHTSKAGNFVAGLRLRYML
ncbi:carbohydrate porin [Paraferrimonas sp. SM1919]|uniref:carbohydrate porin n=1 Tax=Paraferrimonas sp. SM1919 TaxID=2662263 RepID=UPI0013D44F83|nr:carbohydrate porin [Paraferrimonas sp. SM1919]